MTHTPEEDWSVTPQKARDYYASLTFAQQCALAWVVDEQRRRGVRTARARMEVDGRPCSGCGEKFRTGRGYPGNYYAPSDTAPLIVHVCGSCDAVTHIPLDRPHKTRAS